MTKTPGKTLIGVLLLMVAYGMLIPGLNQPLLSLTGMVDKADLVNVGRDIIIESPDTGPMIEAMATAVLDKIEVSGQVQAYRKTRSILGTIEELYVDGFALVAFLVGLFSVVIPVVKGLMLLAGSMLPAGSITYRLRRASDLISKWSMADVFVVGVFVAFLAANAIRQEGGFLSFDAELGSGFYFFLGYCLLSILASQILTCRRPSADAGSS